MKHLQPTDLTVEVDVSYGLMLDLAAALDTNRWRATFTVDVGRDMPRRGDEVTVSRPEAPGMQLVGVVTQTRLDGSDHSRRRVWLRPTSS